MPVTVAIASGKGGVGKSTVALNLACALRDLGRRVGLLDADVYGPDIPRMVNLTRTAPADHVWLGRTQPSALEPVEAHGIEIMSIGLMVAEDQPLDWSSPLVQLLVRRFASDVRWDQADLIVVDLPPGTADVQQFITEQLRPDGVVLVVTPQDVAHLDAKKVAAMYRKAGVEILGGVENMSALVCPDCGRATEIFPPVRPERSIWADGVERLASIPLDPSVAASGDAGRPIVDANPDSAPADAFRVLAASVLAALG